MAFFLLAISLEQSASCKFCKTVTYKTTENSANEIILLVLIFLIKLLLNYVFVVFRFRDATEV